jgi:hypothetical protein
MPALGLAYQLKNMNPPFASGLSTEAEDSFKSSKARAMNCADFCFIRHAREYSRLSLSSPSSPSSKDRREEKRGNDY